MNCKPGDLAIYVDGKGVNAGRIVEVLSASYEGETYTAIDGHVTKVVGATQSWRCRAERPLAWTNHLREQKFYTERAIADRHLKTLRDPGEDARDESLAWLPPVPNSTKETV